LCMLAMHTTIYKVYVLSKHNLLPKCFQSPICCWIYVNASLSNILQNHNQQHWIRCH
jgi:hypothetical protein